MIGRQDERLTNCEQLQRKDAKIRRKNCKRLTGLTNGKSLKARCPMALMNAVRIHEVGGPEVLRYEEVPRPTLGEGEVLIRVVAAAVNPLDWKVRAGYIALWPPYTFPMILGFDVAGVVETVGAGISQFAAGDEVYGFAAFGCHAEYVAAPADDVAHKPQALDYLQAAAMPCAALTAWQALFDAAHLEAGQTVLIHGAAGGVGTFAVQLAKWRGAQVIGTASGHNLAFLRQLGADEVIDYTTTRFEAVARGIDVVLDTVGGETQQRSWSILKPGGILISIVERPSPELSAAHGVRSDVNQLQGPMGAPLAELARLVDAGRLKPIISTVLPLHEARQAHVLSESRHTRGKIVLKVGTYV
jgi:NADPH:quinone reductase-like Zn-dependent oxidoreductase